MKKILVGLLVCASILPAFSAPLRAQANNCTNWIGNGWTLTGGCPSWAIQVVVEGPFLDVCLVVTASCAPPAAASETHPMCPPHRAGAFASQPICLADGNTFIDETDVNLPGLGGGLSLVRTWNSLWPASQAAVQVGLFGPNWRSNFEERVFVGSDGYIKYARGDGSF